MAQYERREGGSDDLECTVALAAELIELSDKGVGECPTEGCLVLNGVLLDCGYRIRELAERELQIHRAAAPTTRYCVEASQPGKRGAAMKSMARGLVAVVLSFLLFPGSAAAALLLSESFETAVPPAGWIKHSPDGGTGWNRQTNGTTPIPGFENLVGTVTTPAGGGNGVAFATYLTGGTVPDINGAFPNDQWLVTPGVAITTAGTNLTFWVRKFTDLIDNLEVKISTTTNALPSFTTSLALYAFGNVPEDWNQKTISLDAFVGQTVFIAFREFVADNFFDGDALFLDLVTIASPLLDQTLTVTGHAPARAMIGDIFAVAATATSGLPVAITATGACSGSGAGTALVTMTATNGNCLVAFNQAGDTNFGAALPVMEQVRAFAAKNDFDGDGRSDLGVYNPTGGNWYLFKSAEGFSESLFGYAGTVPVPGDFDGDGRDDIGVYDDQGGKWFLSKSLEGHQETDFGYAGTIPVVGDFDGDGRDDFGVYDDAGGSWNLFKSAAGFFHTTFGFDGTIPVVGDFDGDGRDDFGVYYPTGGNWYLFKSTEGFFQTAFGYAGTIPVVGDFDGDGRDDIGVYYPPGGNWYQFKSSEGFSQTTFGYAGTEPVVGDFDGDGRDDIGVYYPPGGNWYLFKSAEGFSQTTFGYAGTMPVGGTLR